MFRERPSYEAPGAIFVHATATLALDLPNGIAVFVFVGTDLHISILTYQRIEEEIDPRKLAARNQLMRKLRKLGRLRILPRRIAHSRDNRLGLSFHKSVRVTVLHIKVFEWHAIQL